MVQIIASTHPKHQFYGVKLWHYSGKGVAMPINFTFLMIYMLPLLAIGLVMLVYGVWLLIGEVIGWLYGR